MPQLDMYSIDNNGLDGPNGVQFAQGTYQLINDSLSFSKKGSGTAAVERYILVSGIFFEPTKIIVTRSDGNFPLLSTYVKETAGGASVSCMGDNVFSVTGNSYVNSTGFLIPCRYTQAGTITVTWYAYS